MKILLLLSTYPVDPVVHNPEMASTAFGGNPKRRPEAHLSVFQYKIPVWPAAFHQIDLNSLAAPARAFEDHPLCHRIPDNEECFPETVRQLASGLEPNDPAESSPPPVLLP
jgi:hypothetical protein